MPLFAFVTIATSVERSQKKIGPMMPTHIRTQPENLVNIGPVHFEITGLQGYSLKIKKVTSAHLIAVSPSTCHKQAGGEG